MKRPKLLIQTESYAFGGAEKYLIDILGPLKELFDITFVCPKYREIDKLYNYAVANEIHALRVSKNYWVNPIEFSQIFSLIKTNDIIFINKLNPCVGLPFIFLALLCRKKVVCIEHLTIPVKSKYFFKPPIMKILINTLMKRVGGIIATSKTSKEFFQTYYGYSSTKIEIIHLGIDMPRESVISPLSGGVRSIGLIGRLCNQKGQLEFIDLIYDIVYMKSVTNFRIELWGEGELLDKIKKKISDKQLSDYIFLMGFSPDTNIIYAHLDFIVIPSIHEGQSYVLLEAASFKKPAVAFDVGGVGDFLDHCENGFLITAYNKEQFIDSMIKLIKKPQLCKELGDRAFSKVQDNHSIKKTTSKLIEFISKI